MGDERAAAGGAAGEGGGGGGGEGLRAARSEERERTGVVGAAVPAARDRTVLRRGAIGAAAGKLRTAAVPRSAELSRGTVAVRADLQDLVELVCAGLGDGGAERRNGVTSRRSRGKWSGKSGNRF